MSDSSYGRTFDRKPVPVMATKPTTSAFGSTTEGSTGFESANVVKTASGTMQASHGTIGLRTQTVPPPAVHQSTPVQPSSPPRVQSPTPSEEEGIIYKSTVGTMYASHASAKISSSYRPPVPRIQELAASSPQSPYSSTQSQIHSSYSPSTSQIHSSYSPASSQIHSSYSPASSQIQTSYTSTTTSPVTNSLHVNTPPPRPVSSQGTIQVNSHSSTQSPVSSTAGSIQVQSHTSYASTTTSPVTNSLHVNSPPPRPVSSQGTIQVNSHASSQSPVSSTAGSVQVQSHTSDFRHQAELHHLAPGTGLPTQPYVALTNGQPSSSPVVISFASNMDTPTEALTDEQIQRQLYIQQLIEDQLIQQRLQDMNLNQDETKY